MQRKVSIAVVLLTLSMALSLHAGDRNEAIVRGRVLEVTRHLDSSGVYRVELTFFDQSPANGPYSPHVDCAIASWSACAATNLLPGCTPTCDTATESPGLTAETCYCAGLAPTNGACLEVKAYHDGFRLLSTSVQVRDVTMCTAVP